MMIRLPTSLIRLLRIRTAPIYPALRTCSVPLSSSYSAMSTATTNSTTGSNKIRRDNRVGCGSTNTRRLSHQTYSTDGAVSDNDPAKELPVSITKTIAAADHNALLQPKGEIKAACGEISNASSNDEDGIDFMEQEEMFVEAHESFEHDKKEWGGPRRGGRLPEPTRFGDWERNGRCSDF